MLDRFDDNILPSTAQSLHCSPSLPPHLGSRLEVLELLVLAEAAKRSHAPQPCREKQRRSATGTAPSPVGGRARTLQVLQQT